MGFLSQLRDLLIEFPFDENGAYTLHHSQCQTISAYFVSTLERFFGTILRPLSCNNTSSSSTTSATSTANASFRGWNSFSVFSDNRVLKLWSSRKNKSSSATLSDEYSAMAILEELRSTPYAIEELYRVVKEAQKYLETCGDVDWWKSGIVLGSVREAKDVHVHDLMWCIVGLNLALHTVRGVNLESRSQFTRLDIAKGYAEMAILSSEDSNIIQCEEEDYKQLFLNLSKLKQKYDEMNFVRKIVMNFPDKVKYEMVQFLLQKLKDYSNVETISSLYAKRPSESMQINLEDLVFPSRCRRISGGDCNSFYEASWLGIKVALKEFDYYISKEAFNYEVDLLMAAQCPFVIPLYGWSINMIDHTCYLIQEFVSSNLETLVAEKRTLKKTLHMPVVVDLMLQLARAMEHLHDNKLVHGDLCPANILIEPLSSSPELMEKGYGRVKLSNFSPRRLILDSFRMKNLHYIAPEVWPETLTDHPNYSFESDVYSFAMCFAYSLTGEEPFKGITSITVLKKMVEEGERPNLPSHCPLIFRELLMNCWSRDPSSRPSFAMITMSLRLFKVLIMKTRASDRSLDTAILKEYSFSAPMISYIELSAATTGFSNKANNITMFSMYHGVLSDGTKVLVQSTRDSTNMRQLWTKVSQLLQLRHGNIISLRSVSQNGPKCWFVYDEKVPIQGSLDALLEEGTDACEKPLLDITCCYKIVLGVACGLQYLHGQDLTFVITPESILLDEKHEPMIVVDSIPSEGSLTDMDLENHQCLGVMHFGTLISKLLTYLRHFFLEVDSDHVSTSRALDNQVMVLGEVESLCSAGVLKMNEVVEMLESGYDAYVENNSFYEQQPHQEVF